MTDLKKVLPNLVCLSLDPMHICYKFNRSQGREQSPARYDLKRLMGKFAVQPVPGHAGCNYAAETSKMQNNPDKVSEYIKGLINLLRLFYGTKDLESAYRKQVEYRIQGYIEAGILCKIITKGELQKIIDDEHFAIFNMTRAERREKLKLKTNGPEIDWSIYEVPTIHRR